MPHSLPRLLLWLALSAFCTPLAAQALLGESSSGMSLNAHIDLLVDDSEQLRVEDLDDAQVRERFEPAAGRQGIGRSPHPVWLRITLQRAQDAPAQWWLENWGAGMRDIRVYLPDGAGGWEERRAGEAWPHHANAGADYRRPLFKLPPLGDEPLTVYLRSQDPAGNLFPLRVWQIQDLQQQAAGENLLYGVIYGMVFALLLYNLFILIALRDSAYLWYVLVTGCALVMMLGMSGHGHQLLWPDGAIPTLLDRISMPALWSILLMRFTQALLDTPEGSRWPVRILFVASVLYAVSILLGLLGLRGEAAKIVALLPLVTLPVALCWSIARWRQGFVPAKLYFIGYGGVLISAVLLLLRSANLVDLGQVGQYLFPLAVATESTLFSFALAYRIQMLKRDKADALLRVDEEKSARLAQAQASAEHLGRAVEERTAELEQANRLLSERELELKRAAFHDPLTELPNRRYLIEQVEVALAAATRQGEPVALLLIDLDHFKPINDTHGHDAGDQMLRSIAQRLGGDEFAVLVCGPDARFQAREVAERLLRELARPVLYRDNELTLTVSIGIAFYPEHAQQFAGLYKAADEALYRAKQGGRSGFALQGVV